MSRRRLKQQRSGFSLGMGLVGGTLGVVAFAAILGAAILLAEGEPQRSGSPGSQPDSSSYTPLGALAVSQQSVDLGRVPLDKMVTQVFRLRNISQDQVQLGRVTVAVLEGC